MFRSLKRSGGGNRSGSIDVAATLTAKGQRIDFEVETFVAASPETAMTLTRAGTSAARDMTLVYSPDVAATLTRGAESAGKGGYAGRRQEDDVNIVAGDVWVRRLTPSECARLQGFPDDHARIAWRGKPAEQCPDGPQYKVFGNSMAVNVMRWLGERLDLELRK